MPILGLDLGSDSFRAVELEENRDKIILTKYGLYDSPKKSHHGESPLDSSAYSSAIKSFVSEVGFSTPDVVVSLPESEVFTRVVKLPAMSEKELKSAIAFEAEQYIPIPIKEVNFDFQILDSDVMDKDKMNVLIVAAKNKVLEGYVKMLRDAGLTPRGLEPEALAIGRVLGDDAGRPSASVVVDVGSTSTQIIVTYKGAVRFTRSVPIGGESITRAVAQKLGFEFAQAEEYKKTYGLDKNQAGGKVYDVVKEVFDKILLEIKKSRIFYTTHNPNVIINRVILSGGTALMPGLLFYMANSLDLEVELANPWRNIQFSPKTELYKDQLIGQGPLYVTALGLALKVLK